MSNSILKAASNMSIRHNVTMRVLDVYTGEVVQSLTGHNAATCGLLTGIGHYLKGDSVFNSNYQMSDYIPQFISLGTMGLKNQLMDADGWPLGIGGVENNWDDYTQYMLQTPGFGADGYDENANNNRRWLGLGPAFANRLDKSTTIDCELVSQSYPRTPIAFRDVVPEWEAELPQTVDVVLSAMVSVGALHEFRPEGQDYVFITEAGLWSTADFEVKDGNNKVMLGSGLLAGYRITPPSRDNWVMVPTQSVSEAQAAANRDKLRRSILRVGPNQVVQVIWKIQIGGMDQLGGIQALYQHEGVFGGDSALYWDDWT